MTDKYVILVRYNYSTKMNNMILHPAQSLIVPISDVKRTPNRKNEDSFNRLITAEHIRALTNDNVYTY